jgi:hypothetical protein
MRYVLCACVSARLSPGPVPGEASSAPTCAGACAGAGVRGRCKCRQLPCGKGGRGLMGAHARMAPGPAAGPGRALEAPPFTTAGP